VTGRHGTIGEVFFSSDDFWPLNTTLYVLGLKGNFPKFIYYFLKTMRYQEDTDKAAVPGVNHNHLPANILPSARLASRLSHNPGYQDGSVNAPKPL
jgi:restriction endonuclease S subunit